MIAAGDAAVTASSLAAAGGAWGESDRIILERLGAARGGER